MPYIYQDAPTAIFETVIGLYNSQVEGFKQFVVGTVDVIDANNYIRLESETAEQFGDLIDKLVDRVGGYIVFTTNDEGQRVINWYKDLVYQSRQVIEFGSNLLDFARNGANTNMATVIIPFGAKDETTGERVTIESVNDGLDFIQDDEAVALRGVIALPVYWDDVTEPANLLTKARQYLNNSKMMVTTLELTALDLSVMDKSIDSFQVGDKIRVRSKPHGLDEDFLLAERTVNMLDPSDGRVVLGKEVATLTGADAAGEKKSNSEMHRIERNIKADYLLDIAASIAEAKTTLTSLIQQTEEAIKLEVSETYATGEDVESKVAASLQILKDEFNFYFDTLDKKVDDNGNLVEDQFEELHKYIRFREGDIILGEEGNELTLRIQNDRISFLDGGAEVAYFSNQKLVVTDGRFLNSLQIGAFAWIPRENGNLSLVKVVND